MPGTSETTEAPEKKAEAVVEAPKELKHRKMNLLLKILPGQMVKVEDVIDYKMDSLGITITHQELVQKKDGDKIRDFVYTSKKWFNSTVIITYAEEWIE